MYASTSLKTVDHLLRHRQAGLNQTQLRQQDIHALEGFLVADFFFQQSHSIDICITAYLENGGPIENARAIAAHKSPRMIKLTVESMSPIGEARLL
jgi:hypothetical protein